MATSKVIYSGRTLIDLTGDTVTEESLLRGYTAHKADGTIITRNSICWLSKRVYIPGCSGRLKRTCNTGFFWRCSLWADCVSKSEK